MRLENSGTFFLRRARARLFAGALASLALVPIAAQAGPSVVVDVGTGQVLEQDQATKPWFPASLTKLMTVYVALSAVRDGRTTLDTPFVMSYRAARMAPSKMGFPPGTAVTLDNALKMLMVKSANDIAIMIAEGISGSVEDFATEMNATAQKLGLHESHFMNPNGLPDPEHMSSARDMAMIATALYRDFPEDAGLFDIGALRLTNGQIIPTHNGLLGRYDGADGMKTGFICASGFNVVASATRNGRHLVAVVMGSQTAKSRTLKVAGLLDAAFAGLLQPTGSTLPALPATGDTQPADIRDQICGKHRNVQEDDFAVPVAGMPAATGDAPASAKALLGGHRPAFVPLDVFIGPKPGWEGNVAKARDMPGPMEASAYIPKPVEAKAETETPAAKPSVRHGKVGRAAAKAIAAKTRQPTPASVAAAKAKADAKPAKTAQVAPKAAPKPAPKPAAVKAATKQADKPAPAKKAAAHDDDE